MRAAVIQLNSRLLDRRKNVLNAMKLVGQAARKGAEFVLLPECMTFLGGYEHYAEIAEDIAGPTAEMAAETARKYGIYLHIGSLTECAPVTGKYYNTSLLFDPQGELVATYRKVHLFDIDVPDQVSETESAFVLPGNQLVTVKLPDFHLGMSICFDLRFPELYPKSTGGGGRTSSGHSLRIFTAPPRPPRSTRASRPIRRRRGASPRRWRPDAWG